MYQDETLICEDCGKEFTFTAGEQEFYAEKGLTNKPKDAKHAERQKSKCTEVKNVCLMLFVLNVENKHKCRSIQHKDVMSFVKNVLMQKKLLRHSF